MAFATDISQVSTEEKPPVLDISPIVDLPSRLTQGFKGLFDMTLTAAEHFQSGFSFEDDISAASSSDQEMDGRDLIISFQANSRIELLIRKYSGKITDGEDIRFKMLTQKIRKNLEAERLDKYESLLEISKDIKKVSQRSAKRKQFISTLK